MLREIEEFIWNATRHSWVDAGGEPVSPEKNEELSRQSEALFQQQMMERLESARAIFHSMPETQERKAAMLWLNEIYDL